MRFAVSYRITGSASETIEAETQEEANAIIDRRVEDEDFVPDLDSADDVTFTINQMHPVTRDGREIWTTYVTKNDVRGHRSALDETPLFSGVLDQEAALSSAVA